MLLNAGANPNNTKYGISPLHGAAGWNKDPKVIIEIIEAGTTNSGLNLKNYFMKLGCGIVILKLFLP